MLYSRSSVDYLKDPSFSRFWVVPEGLWEDFAPNSLPSWLNWNTRRLQGDILEILDRQLLAELPWSAPRQTIGFLIVASLIEFVAVGVKLTTSPMSCCFVAIHVHSKPLFESRTGIWQGSTFSAFSHYADNFLTS